MNDLEIEKQIELLRTSNDLSILRRAIERLGQIGDSGKQVMIFAFFLLMKIGLYRVASLLLQDYQIGKGNSQAITELVKILSTSQNVSILWRAAESLEKIGAGNPQAIKALVKILSTSKDDLVLRQAAESLEQIGVSNPQAIKALVKILSTSKDDLVLRQAAESLGKIGAGNPQVIKALV
ncbi:MAG: HEAT repeat domain-containing protein, partial [Xenococcus sp. MO_188.B8]|nr:HEAT repeat domain-containing protein [Xenococcus sp. MO_188.B8]